MINFAPLKRLNFLKLIILVALIAAAPGAFAATLSISPDTGVYTSGGTFTVSVVLNTAGDPVNAAEGTIKFNAGELSVVGVSRTTSIFNLWTQEPTYSNSAGTVSFGGGSPSGYSGSRGTVMTITFMARNAGTARVNFSNGSVLAADGLGTNVLTNMNGGTFTIASQEVQPEPETIEYIAPANTPATPQIQSTTHPDSQGWYQSTEAKLSWTIPSGVTAVRTLLDGNSGSIPTKVYDPPINSIDLAELDQGVSYFHLQYRNSEGWGRLAHYRLGVDSVDPETFELSIPEDADLTNPIQTIAVEFVDATSPLSRYQIQIDDQELYEFTEFDEDYSFALPALTPGKHSIIVEAFDSAGNSIIDTLSFNIIAFDKPIFTEYPSELNEGVIPVLKGQTKPEAEVEITMKRSNDEVPMVTRVIADQSGEFVFIPDAPLGLGVYTVSAVAFEQSGAQSEPSDPIKIAVQQPGYFVIGSLVISALSIIIPLLALLFLLVFLFWFSFTRFKSFRRSVRSESKEALEMLHKEFNELRAALHDGEAAMTDSRKTKKLTKAETELIERLHLEINDSEARVEKEIKDVQDLGNKSLSSSSTS